MSPRTTGLLLIVALLLGAFVYVVEIREPGDGETPGKAADELFPEVDAAAVQWVELTTTDEHTVRAERTAEGWRLTRPGDYAADQAALSGIASQLASLRLEGRVEGRVEGTADGDGDAALAVDDFGLGESASVVRFGTADAEHTLRIGKRTPVGSNTYVRAEPGVGVAYVSTWRTNALRKRLAELRDRRIVDFDHAAIDAVEVRWPAGGVALEKDASGWRLVRPVQERADRSTVETLLSDLAFLQADDFVDEPLDAAEAGLDPPVATVRLGGEAAAGGRFSLALAFGALRDDRRVVRGPAGDLFLVAAERLQEIPREVLAYRFKTLGEFDVADARTLALDLATATGTRTVEAELAAGRWRTVPQPVPDSRVRAMVSSLSRLSAAAIVAESAGPEELEGLGLRPPRVRVRVGGEAGEVLAEVAIGMQAPDGTLLAKRPDSPVIYRLDETVQASLPTGDEDFAERFVGEAETPEGEPDAPVDPLDPDEEDTGDEMGEPEPSAASDAALDAGRRG